MSSSERIDGMGRGVTPECPREMAHLQKSAGCALLSLQSWSSYYFEDGLKNVSSLDHEDDRAISACNIEEK